MGIFNNNLKIDIENPFKNDKLHREEEVKNLTAMFDIVNNQMVLAVNSQWGTGKTSFLRMWNQYLINEEYKTIFFNAWENDYVEDPFIAFVDEIRESINDENKVRGLMEKAKEVSLALFKQMPKMASKIIKEKTGVDSEEIISNDELTKIVADKIDNYNKNKKSVDKFKIELEKIANKEFEENKKPMIIFVDELDRCRPDYAISLLERIKHFFYVQNIVFILGIDKEALSNSIRVIYGEQTDINGYLTRFIDLEYRLKESNSKEYVEYLLDKYDFRKLVENRKFDGLMFSAECNFTEFQNLIINIITGFKLSLRDIEKFIVEVYMILRANVKKYIYPHVLMLLCVLRKIDKATYNRVKFNQISYGEFVSSLEKQNINIKDWLEDIDTCILKAYLIWLLKDNIEINSLKESITKMDESNSYMNKDFMCLELYNSIAQGKEYRISQHNEQVIKQNIYKMAELYDSFNTISGE